ncbi:MAG: cupin domain-containing protein [Candidatus Delongbacteria bacterium]|nr:cupin domain-containing protein [Candidatus Delongbacteria bacterium]MBN2835957.1 cupin domain-containing protein [Candidatus Delongbacteria bacterium]
MKPKIFQYKPESEFYTEEQCYITELSNSELDDELSIALARVEPGITTKWHRLIGTTERYIILEGKGIVEIGNLTAQVVNARDVVIIPPGCRQRITNTGSEDLVFYALCTPRFKPQAYEDID